MTGEPPPRLAWSSPRDVIWAECRAWLAPWLGRLSGGWRMLWIALGCVAIFVVVMYASVGSVPVRARIALIIAIPGCAAVLAMWPVWVFVRVTNRHDLPPIIVRRTGEGPPH